MINGRDVDYWFESVRMVGYFCADDALPAPRPGILLVHDAYGLGAYTKHKAEEVAALGYAVLAADVWGYGKEPVSESERGALTQQVTRDSHTWMGRLREAHRALLAQSRVDPARTAMIGYCFGGTSALEYSRTIGGIRGAISFHGGLNRVGRDWSAAPAGTKLLILTGFEDPRADMASLLELEQRLMGAKIDWEVDIYSKTKHGFTRPDSDRANKPQLGYNAQSDRRSWSAMSRFLAEIFSE
jgi:dienelactone hydrolase